MINIYVCYADYDCEGCGPPERVFDNENSAKDYCDEYNSLPKVFCTVKYKELEMNETTIRSNTGA